jgi:hypothetical protein
MSNLVTVSEKSYRSAHVNFGNDCNEISLHANRPCNLYCIVAGSTKADVAPK